MKDKRIDLHTHSTISDGSLTPKELAEKGKEIGLSAIALTDHDTVSGVSTFLEVCQKIGIEGVSGVEISARYKQELHIVGLFVDHQNQQFQDKLYCLKNARLIRNRKMIQKMQDFGLQITEADIAGEEHLGCCGRVHMAQALIQKGYAKSIQECFDKYLDKSSPCYERRETFSIAESIDMIHGAGGLAIWAHPVYIAPDEEQLTEKLKMLVGFGIDGMECMYSAYEKSYMKLCFQMAEQFHILPSGGSDYHAENRKEVSLGIVCGDMHIPYSILEKMKEKIK